MPTTETDEGCESARERLARVMLAEFGFSLEGDVLDVGAVRELSRTRLLVLVDSDTDEAPVDPDAAVSALVVGWDEDGQTWLVDEPEDEADFETLSGALEWFDSQQD